MDKEKIEKLKKIIECKDLAGSHKMLKSLCGPTRFRIVTLLNHEKGGLSVTEISSVLKLTLSRVSHQLRILKDTKIVESEGRGREIIYKLSDHKLRKIFDLLF